MRFRSVSGATQGWAEEGLGRFGKVLEGFGTVFGDSGGCKSVQEGLRG